MFPIDWLCGDCWGYWGLDFCGCSASWLLKVIDYFTNGRYVLLPIFTPHNSQIFRFLFMPIRTVASATTLPPPHAVGIGYIPRRIGCNFLHLYFIFWLYFYLSTDGVILRCHLCSNCQIYKISLVASKNFNCCVKSVDISALKSVIFVFPVGTHN